MTLEDALRIILMRLDSVLIPASESEKVADIRAGIKELIGIAHGMKKEAEDGGNDGKTA